MPAKVAPRRRYPKRYGCTFFAAMQKRVDVRLDIGQVSTRGMAGAWLTMSSQSFPIEHCMEKAQI
jgi:hypothetical protein